MSPDDEEDMIREMALDELKQEHAAEVARLTAEIERLRAVGNEAFLAMCAYRDSPDTEVFQDAIDALGTALAMQ